MRVILFLLAAWIAYFLISRAIRQRRTPTAAKPVTQTVRCAHCGTHVPAHAAFQHSDGRRFCSIEHAREVD